MKKLALVVLLSFYVCKIFSQVAPLDRYGRGKPLLAFVSKDSLLTCYDYDARISNGSGETLRNLPFPNFGMRVAAFCAAKKLVAGGGNYGEFRVWNLNGQLIKNFAQFGSKRYNFTAVSFSPDGSKVVAGTQKNIAFVWRLNGELIGTIDMNRKFSKEAEFEEIVAVPDYGGMIDTNFVDNRGISCLKFSNDGEYIFAASHGGKKTIWNLDCQPIYSLAAPSKTVREVDFAPSGDYILTGHEDGSVMMWNKKGELLHETKNQFPILQVKFAADGKKYFYGDDMAWVTTKDLQGYSLNKEQLNSNPAWNNYNIGHINNLVFSADNNRVAINDNFKKNRIQNINEPKSKEIRIDLGSPQINSFAFAPDGKRFISGNHSRERVTLYDLNFTPLYQFDEIGYRVNSVAFAPDGNTILIGGENKSFSQWSLSGHLIQEFKGQEGEIDFLIFSPDGKFILSVAKQGTLVVWDRAGNVVRKIGTEGFVSSVAFSPDGKQVLIVDSGGLSLFNLSGEKIFQNHPNPHLSLIIARFSSDGKKIIVGTNKGLIVMDTKGNLLKEVNDAKEEYKLVSISKDGLLLLVGKYQMSLRGIQGNVLKTIKIDSTQGFSAADFSPNGDMFLLGGGNKSSFESWSKEGSVIKSLKPHRGFLSNLKFSSDNQKIISYGTEDNTIITWSLQGTQLHRYDVKIASRITSSFISPKDFIYVSSLDGKLNVFDLKGQLKRQVSLIRTTSDYLSIVVSPNEKMVIIKDTTHTATLQNIEPGKEKTVLLEGHKLEIESVAFSPDGNYVLTGSKDKTAMLWNTDGQLLKKLIGHKGEITKVVFSPNGELLATASNDNWIFVWDKAGNRVGEIFIGKDWNFYLAFSADSKTIFAQNYSDTNAIFQYSFKGGKIKKLPKHYWPVTGLAVSADGKYVATAAMLDSIIISKL